MATNSPLLVLTGKVKTPYLSRERKPKWKRSGAQRRRLAKEKATLVNQNQPVHADHIQAVHVNQPQVVEESQIQAAHAGQVQTMQTNQMQVHSDQMHVVQESQIQTPHAGHMQAAHAGHMQAAQSDRMQAAHGSQIQAVDESQKELASEDNEEWKALPLPGLEFNYSNKTVKKMELHNPTPVKVTSANALTVSMQGYSPEKYFMTRVDYWHKFIIEGGSKYNGDLLLKILMDAVYPVDIVAVLYQVEGDDFTFLARNCGPAVIRLCKSNMVLMLPNGIALNVQVILGYKHIRDMPLNMQQKLLKVIQKRYNKEEYSLDLSNYCKDPDLEGLIFCPLSQPRILGYVLRSAKRVSWMKEIDLSHNEITNLRTMEVAWYTSIKKLNLSNNLLASVKELEVLVPMNLTDLSLDQNPLCAEYKDEMSYISAVRSILPTLEVLDGVELGPPGFPLMKRNHMWSDEDAKMADRFLQHYFTLYDSDNRRYLLGLYHQDASFSLTAHYIPGQNTSSSARLTDYTIESRNLLRISDYAKNMNLLHQGSEDILATLCRLPRSEHDPYSFCVDVTHLPSGVVISVNGVFREPTISKEPLVRSFNRIFILIPVSPTEYQIANEMLHICNATTKQVEDSFKIPKTKSEALPAKVPLNLNESEKEQMTEIFSSLTEMNFNCSKQCLEEASWNIRDALTAFLQLYKANKIPVDAFIR